MQTNINQEIHRLFHPWSAKLPLFDLFFIFANERVVRVRNGVSDVQVHFGHWNIGPKMIFGYFAQSTHRDRNLLLSSGFQVRQAFEVSEVHIKIFIFLPLANVLLSGDLSI